MQKGKVVKIALILLVAFLLRFVFVFFVHPPEKYIYSDMGRYHRIAISLAQGEKEDIFNTFHPPGALYLYSLFFRLPKPFLWIKIFHVLISTGSCFLIFLSTRLIFNAKAALIALSLSSINYLFIDFTGYLLPATSFIFSLSLMFYFLLKSVQSQHCKQKWAYSFWAGLFVIVSASLTPTILLFIPFFALWWLFNFRKYRLASNIPFYLIGFLPLYILLCFRVYSLTGQWGTISTNGGLNFYVGRAHPSFVYLHNVQKNRKYQKYQFASPVAIQKNYTYSPHFEKGPYDSAFFFKEGLEVMRQDIRKTIKYSLEYLNNLFCSTVIWPSVGVEGFSDVIKYFNIAFVYIVILPSALLLFIKFKEMTGGLPLLAYLGILVILSTAIIFHAEPRYRVPYDIFFIMLAGYFYSLVDWKQIKEKHYGLHPPIGK